MPAEHPFPHPDFFQIVMTGIAAEHKGNRLSWVDAEGWETRSWLVTPAELDDLDISMAERHFASRVLTR